MKSISKEIRKAIVGAGTVLVSLVLAAQMFAATITVNVPASSYVQVLTNRGSATISQVLVTSTTTNSANVQLWDSISTSELYTNPAYSTISSYATNVITTWTNFYGVTNSFTNVGLIDYTNNIAATTNNYPLRFTAKAPTNTTAVYGNVNYYFVNGVWATNAGFGSASITVTYQ